MQHKVYGKKLSRDRNERQSLFKGLISTLFIYGKLETTESKAKAIKGLADKMISDAKKGTVEARRLVSTMLYDKKLVNKLVDEIAPSYKDRNSGFTRTIRLGKRSGDKAMMVKMELVEGIKVEKKEKPVNVKAEVVSVEKPVLAKKIVKTAPIKKVAIKKTVVKKEKTK